MSEFRIHRAETLNGAVVDVHISDGRVSAIAELLPPVADEVEVFDARGGALLPGLHDHHLHLFALAAAQASVECGPPQVMNRDGLLQALADANPADGFVRGVSYHESVAGDLDRWSLTSVSPGGVPVRVQHRSGALWILNCAAIEALELGREPTPQGVERNDAGELTGRVYYEDTWLREQLLTAAVPDLSTVGYELASCGVTGVTDATPDKGAAEYEAISLAIEKGELIQRVVSMGGTGFESDACPNVELGPVKIMLREPALPEFDDLVGKIARAHDANRNVAFHCVTRTELIFAAEALREAAVRPGDRIEHASIAPPELVDLLAQQGVWVVTQPGFIYERGDTYKRDVEPDDQRWLYRGRGFLDGGVPLGAGTDAPYGSADPWVAIRAAVDRRTRAGETLGAAEALSPERALALFTSPLEAPGERPSEIAVGSEVDFCVLDVPWRVFRERLNRDHVVMTLRDDKIVWRRNRDEGGTRSRLSNQSG